MSGSGRRRSSKWDLRDEPEFVSDSKQLRSGWSSANVTGSNSSKWSYLEGNEKLKPNMRLPYKEPFSGGRVSNKDDIMNKDYNRDLDAKMAWDADESYGMKMSPGLEEWKRKRRSHSPKNGLDRSRSRSRSRSPALGFRWESGVNDRNRMRDGGLPQPCRDFAVGKCRRGSRCHFLHHDNRNYEDGWDRRNRKDGPPRYSAPYESRDISARSGRSSETCINFAQGKCRMGASCKSVHHSNSDDMSKGNVDESTREREFDQRRRESSFERSGGHEPNRFSGTPCKFYAAGNCRNGKHCRFSHDRQASRSPNRRLRDDRWGDNPGGDQALDRTRGSNSVSPGRRLRDDRWGPDMVDVDKMWDGPQLNDAVAVPDTAKLGEDKSGNMGIPDPGFTTWPRTDGWGDNLDNNKVYAEPPFVGDKKKVEQWKTENAGTTMGAPQSIVTDKWLDDAEMSPDWNYGSGSSGHIEDKSGQKKQGLTQGGAYLATSEHSRLQVAPGQGFNQNTQNVNALHPSSCNVVGQSQGAVPVAPPLGGLVEVIQNQASSVKKFSVEPNIMDASLSHVSTINNPTQNMVSNEQLAHLNSLSASLVHFLGTGQQLPQIYAALNSHDAKDTSSLPKTKTEVSGEPVSSACIKPDPVIGSRKLYDPMNDGMEPKKTDAGGITPSFSPSKTIADGSGKQNHGDSYKTSEAQIVKSEHLMPLQPGQKAEANEGNNDVAAEERQDSRAEDRNAKDNGPSENMDQNGPDEAKKMKDVKGIRAFKFALVEFVKELLKPTWKEGHINKEHYKTIVKKVVDKVTGTMQGAHIPQTQEKIDHYLSVSKPKLNKLVQAYVEKVQKA
ncbi:zinc finger CCCH domain-containing protein 38-like isoform X2 [Prosopis cineraria]|uniref:zinc finger CCCH domain-containing protein 38-like isoform X2 n=1 Tax=Prosopis cineraria TaxID=364024 RepID=UPI00240ECFCE|nr:zinc finger CCCH domain-containing protein 38-like isoform X2 [Prosopis cineraria]